MARKWPGKANPTFLTLRQDIQEQITVWPETSYGKGPHPWILSWEGPKGEWHIILKFCRQNEVSGNGSDFFKVTEQATGRAKTKI